MTRKLDSVCKMCRREGIKLYLKGSRCESAKCPIERKRPAPGMHGYRRGKTSEYGVRLREKQKLKRFYGILEKQFRRYFYMASHASEATGDALLSLLERRLDNCVHRMGWAQSRAAARQLVSHGHIMINGQHCDIPSRLVKAGDIIRVKSRPKTLELVRLNMQDNAQLIPDFLEMVGDEPPEAKMIRLPMRADVDPRLNRDRELQDQLIIEVSSR